jgi:pimeloyl-ACP methyl ester carboxylesterase
MAKCLIKLAGILFIAAILVGCNPKETTNAWFEETDCQFSYPSTRQIACGYLHVPEDRNQENSSEIQLHVAIIKSYGDKPVPDPVVVLQGGPGYKALENIDYWLFLFQKVIQTRDVIVFDQRGVGFSTPSLNCPEVETPLNEQLDTNRTSKEDSEIFNQAALTCQERLIDQGITLAAYTSAENAADVNDLRIALGYRQWNLYGSSYGTRLALTVMRDFPNGVRSVVLDSTYPPQANLYTTQAKNGERAMNLIFERCAADLVCSQKFPNLKTIFYDLVDQLDSEPVIITVYHPILPEKYDLLINGDRLIYYFFNLLYDSNRISEIPEIIYELHQGRWGNFPNVIKWGVFNSSFFSEGMYLSVQCGEEVSFTKAKDFDTKSTHTRFSTAMNADGILSLCEDWATKPVVPAENEPVISDLPTLILSGEFDPITPPAWGQLTAETLSNATFLEFPGISHGVLGMGTDGGLCTFKILEEFLANPNGAVDANCINQLPPFTFSK